MSTSADNSLCMVAILKHETRFVPEWLAYHRLMGVDHFILFDNDPELPLRRLLAAQADWVTVVDWPGEQAHRPGNACQTAAYLHALPMMRGKYRWVSFLDGDEFIVLRRHGRLQDLLAPLAGAGAVRLHWHNFGHNGCFDDPPGLVTSALTRRCRQPSSNFKTISRVEGIRHIWTPHFCELEPGLTTVDGNGRPFTEELYSGKTDVAHVNHYRCRSFRRWMARARRGDAMGAKHLHEPDRWRLDEASLLRRFVEVVAREDNELVDDFLAGMGPAILSAMRDLGLTDQGVASAPG